MTFTLESLWELAWKLKDDLPEGALKDRAKVITDLIHTMIEVEGLK